MKKIDYSEYINKKINHLTILDVFKKNGCQYLHCKCDCGNPEILTICASNVRLNKTTSCGCVQSQRAKESNSRYNKYDLSGEYGIGWTRNGFEFYFDLEDYDKIKDYCWSKKDNYLRADSRGRYKLKHIKMHRLIMNVIDDIEFNIDHINHNEYDNRKQNLRICTQSENNRNKAIPSSNTSGFKGVSWDKQSNKWGAYITVNYKHMFLGYFEKIEDAVQARKEAEEKYFGEFSYDNSQKIASKFTKMSE